MEILIEGDKILQKKSKKISKIDDTIRTFCVSMIKTMISANGVGLSAPQVGVSKRIIVFLEDNKNPRVLINPEIVKFSEKKVFFEEGCLSVPGKMVNIERPKTITVKYRQLSGHPKIETFDNLNSRIIQHEIEHLDGVLITSYE